MPLPPQKSLSQYNTDFTNAYVAGLNPAFGVTVAGIPTGDPVLALGGAISPQAVYLQGLIYQLLGVSRASTSKGADLDTWLADFGYTRPQGGAATARVTFSTSNGLPTLVDIQLPPNTTIVQTNPVVAGPSSIPTSYSFFVSPIQLPGVQTKIAAGQNIITLNCTAATPGSIYNFIPASTPLNLQQPIAGVGNPVIVGVVSGGVDQASDKAALAGFINYIQSLSSATKAAIITAVQNSNANLVYGQNFILTDAAQNTGVPPHGPIPQVPPGMIYVLVANPAVPAGGLDNTSALAQSAVNATLTAEAFGVTAAVYDCKYYTIGAVILAASVSVSACVLAGITSASVISLAQTLVFNYINTLGIGQPIVWSTLVQLMRNISVVSATGTTVTGIVTDVGVTAGSATLLANYDGTLYRPSVYDTILPGSSAGNDQYGIWQTTNTTTFTLVMTLVN